jgi:hypothetical protein
MDAKINIIQDKNMGKLYYTPTVNTRLRIGDEYLEVICVKINNSIKVYIDFEHMSQGFVMFNSRKELTDFRNSIIGISSSPYTTVKDFDIKNWKDYEFVKDISWKEIEEKITFHTLVSIIELAIPTNWLLLLPLE